MARASIWKLRFRLGSLWLYVFIFRCGSISSTYPCQSVGLWHFQLDISKKQPPLRYLILHLPRFLELIFTPDNNSWLWKKYGSTTRETFLSSIDQSVRSERPIKPQKVGGGSNNRSKHSHFSTLISVKNLQKCQHLLWKNTLISWPNVMNNLDKLSALVLGKIDPDRV